MCVVVVDVNCMRWWQCVCMFVRVCAKEKKRREEKENSRIGQSGGTGG